MEYIFEISENEFSTTTVLLYSSQFTAYTPAEIIMEPPWLKTTCCNWDLFIHFDIMLMANGSTIICASVYIACVCV